MRMKQIDQIYKRNKLLLTHLPQNDDFLRTIESVFYVARFFGVITTGGTFAMIWFMMLLLLHLAMETGTIYKVIKTVMGSSLFSTGNRSVAARLSGAIFYGNGLLSLILFWRLRSAWTKLTHEWCLAESTTGLYFPPDKGLRRRLLIVIGVVAIFSCLEHVLSMVAAIGLDCPVSAVLRTYILNSHAFLIIPSDYSLPLGMALFILSKISTIMWNFQDMVIILISVGLSSRYKRLNKYVHQITIIDKSSIPNATQDRDDYVALQTWRKIREAYVRQAALVRNIDKELGGLILLSNSNNFYFICLQVFNGVGGEMEFSISKVYFFVSIAWLIARASAVVLAGADVNVESKTALKYLYTCPDICFNVEVARLEKQLSRDFVALSGMGFFILDRTMLLEVAANIIKYELVLLEFDEQ